MRKKIVSIASLLVVIVCMALIVIFKNQSLASANIVPTPIFTSEDTTIIYEGLNAGLVYEDGHLGYLDVGYQGTFGNPLEVRVLLKFDLPPTPSGYEIETANLYIPVTGGAIQPTTNFSLKVSTSIDHSWVQDSNITSPPAPTSGSTQTRVLANNVPVLKPTLAPFDFTSYISAESTKANARATFILSGMTAQEAAQAGIPYSDHYIQMTENHMHDGNLGPYLIITYSEIVNIEITGVTDGGLYNTNVTPQFNVGTATLNGSPFTSGTTISAEGSYTLTVTAGSQLQTIQFRIDKTPPTGTVIVNQGNQYTNTGAVNVSVTPDVGVTDITNILYSVNGLPFTKISYVPVFLLGIGPVNGDKTLSFKLVDAAGNESPEYQRVVTLDTVPPTGSVVINNGNAYTTSTAVTLNLALDSGVTDVVGVQYSNNNSNWTLDEPFSSTRSFTLSSGDGNKTVYVRLIDRAGNITVIQDSIILDTTPPTGTVVVNDGRAYTNNSNVNVNITPAAGVTDIVSVRYTLNGLPPTTIAYTDSFTINVGSTDGEKAITVELIDGAGHASPVYSATVTLDKVEPTGSITINGGAAYTISQAVTLDLALDADVDDVEYVRFSNDNLTWSDEESFSASMSYTLPAGDGSKTVYVRFIDRAGNIGAAQDSITLDTVAPTGTLSLTSPAVTNVTNVTFTVTSSDADYMELGEVGQSYAARVAYSDSVQTYTLQDIEEDGVKTIQVRLSDEAGNTTVLTADVTLDRTAPTGTVVVNGGEPYTNNADVIVDVTPATGVTDIAHIRYTVNGTSNTIAYTDSFVIDVGSTNEAKEIMVELIDEAGNISPEYTSTVTLDTEPPTGTVAINGGAAYATAAEVTLNLTLGAGVTDVEGVQFSNDNLTWSTVQAYSSSISYTLPTGDGSKTVYVRFIDRAGNIGTAQDSITLDTIAPTGTLSLTSPAVTNATNVTFTVTSSDADYMELGEVGQSYAARVAYSDSVQTYTLQDIEEDGVKTIQVRLSDEAGNATVLTADVTLDRTAPTGTVVVNGGELYTNDADVIVDVTPAADVTDIANIRYSVNDTPTTIAYTDSFVIDVGSTNEAKEITVELIDEAGNVSPQYTSTVTLDTVAPTGTVAINGGAAYTTSAEVTLNFTLGAGVTDVVGVQFSNDDLTWSTEQAYSSSISYTLTAGDGNKTVYVQFIDQAGNIGTAQDSITLDTVAPTGQLVINNNEQFSNSLELELTLTTPDSSELAGVRFSSDESTWSSLEDFTSTKQWLVESNGDTSVYVKFIDKAGNEYVTSSSIYVDTVQPIVTIAIEAGAELTFSDTVELTIDASDPGRELETVALEMELSHDGISWLPAESYIQNKEWTVSSGYGTKHVYARVIDEAGNASETVSASIHYRSIPQLTNSTVNATEDTQYSFVLTDFTYTNDDNIELDSYTLISLPEHGVLMLDEEEVEAGAVVTADQLVELVYVPQLNWFGTEQLEWHAKAAGVVAATNALITIQVAAVNDAPVAEDFELTKTNFTPAEGTLDASDIEEDTLTFHIVDSPAKGQVTLDENTGAFTFTLDQKLNGTYTFTYRVFDGMDYSEVATVTIKYSVRIPSTDNPVPGNVMLKLGEDGPEVAFTGLIQAQGNSLEIRLTEEQLTQLGKAHENQSIELSFSEVYTNAQLIVTNQALNKLATNGNQLIFTTSGIQFILSNQELKQMLSTSHESYTISIKHASGELLAAAQEQARKGAYQLIGVPITFELLAQSEGANAVQLEDLGTIVLSSANASNVPTALLKLLSNGVQSPILAKISTNAQGYQVLITNYGSGTYTLISKQPNFSDVSGWSVAAIEKLASKLILNGVNETTFEPKRAITRAEFASIISKALGLVNTSGSLNYTDVAAGAWYSDAVAAVAELGFMNGYPDGSYRPAQQITREEAMVIVARVLSHLGSSNTLSVLEVDSILSGYSDQAQISSWSRNHIALTVKEGIIMGNNGKLSVKDQITREQIAAVIVRLLERAEVI